MVASSENRNDFKDVVNFVDHDDKRTDFLDRIFLHPVLGLLSLAVMMFIVFQAVFAWAEPFKAAIEDGVIPWLGEWLNGAIHQPATQFSRRRCSGRSGHSTGFLATNFDSLLLYFGTRRIRLFTACSVLAR